MAKDHRLDLGRYVTNPFNERGRIRKNLDFNELFRAKPDSGDYPWNPSRFTQRELINKVRSKQRRLNPTLNFVSNSPFFDTNTEVTSDYELFEGLGRFNRPNDYDFNEGRAMTRQRPEQQPDFNPVWVEAYKLSPTVKPGRAAKNPMPRMRNPDPNGYLLLAAENRAENENEGKMSIAQLLNDRTASKSLPSTKTEEEEGQKTANEASEEVTSKPAPPPAEA
jgi:hypothetical protein